MVEIPKIMKIYKYTDSLQYKELYFKLLQSLYRVTYRDPRKYSEIKFLVETEVRFIQKFIKKEINQTRMTQYEKN